MHVPHTLLPTPPFPCLPPAVISPPVGYQRVQGRGDDEGEGEGEGESDKELYVKEGAITQPKPIPEELSKSYPTHTSTKVNRKESGHFDSRSFLLPLSPSTESAGNIPGSRFCVQCSY